MSFALVVSLLSFERVISCADVGLERLDAKNAPQLSYDSIQSELLCQDTDHPIIGAQELEICSAAK